jgi:hypothetical protein
MALPATEQILCHFVAKLVQDGKTIKVYLSAVRHLHIGEGIGDPFQAPLNRLLSGTYT